MNIHYFLIVSLLVGCSYNPPKKADSTESETFAIDTIPVFDDGKVVRQKVGVTEYFGYAKAAKNDAAWTGYPYFFQPANRNYGVLELKELSVPDGSQLGNLTVVQIPLTPGKYAEEDVAGTQIYYVFLGGNSCSSKGFYQIEDTIGWHSNIEVLEFDSINREIKARFNLRFRLNEADAKRYPDLPPQIVFKNGIVRARDIRRNSQN